MYTINTELTRDTPQGDPLDVVRVVGVSPIKRPSVEEWAGVGGDCVIVTPVEEFGPNEVVPNAVLQELYSISKDGEEEAPTTRVIDTTPRRAPTLLSPEQQFAAAAKADKPTASTRAKTKAVTG